MPSDGGIPFEDDDPRPAVHLPDDGRGRIHGVRDDAPRSAWAAGLPREHSPRWQRPPPEMPAEPPADWVLPWWAERQLDPDSVAYAPEPSQCRYWNRDQKVKARLLANTRGRSWTFVGRPETLGRATVDPRGLVTWGGGGGAWSLDWWIRAGEGWVFPSRRADVRQCLVAGMPVVETVLPVGGGDVVHRVAAAGDASSTIGEATLRRAYSQSAGPRGERQRGDRARGLRGRDRESHARTGGRGAGCPTVQPRRLRDRGRRRSRHMGVVEPLGDRRDHRRRPPAEPRRRRAGTGAGVGAAGSVSVGGVADAELADIHGPATAYGHQRRGSRPESRRAVLA